MRLGPALAGSVCAALLCATTSCTKPPLRTANGATRPDMAGQETDGFDRSGIVLVAARTPIRHGAPASKLGSDQLTARERTLLPFFAALKSLQTGARKDPVTILQIGDSHTAGDFLSGEMRKLLQAKFGGAGRGFVPPGFPDKYYRPDLVEVTESKDWQRVHSKDGAADDRFGIAGVIQRAAGQRQTMTMTSTEDNGFDHGFVEVLGQGQFDLTVDNSVARNVDVTGDMPQGNWLEFNVPPGSHTLKLETVNDSPVTLLSWGIQRQTPGILYANLGTIGATAKLIGQWNPPIVQSELQHLDPALILVAFGTNEAFGNPNDLVDFQKDFIDYVNVLAKAAPGAAIVIVGPPDVNRRYRRPPGVAGDCTTRPLAGAALVTGSQPTPPPATTKRKTRVARNSAVWAPPPELATIRAEEKEAADSQGWYFWDWSAAMGGACSAHRWTLEATPLSQRDHVHQTIAGYSLTADRLFADLMKSYDRYSAYNDRHPNALTR